MIYTKPLFPTILFLAFASACTGVPTGNTATTGVPTKIKFDDATAASGVTFQHVPTRTDNKYMPEVLGSGVAIADFNRDGAPDIFLVNSGALGSAVRSGDSSDRLFINDGKGAFSDKTAEWNLPSAGYGMGVAVGDVDNDGWTDVFVTSFDGNNRLLRNTGTGFEDITTASKIAGNGAWASSAGFADFDNDGDLDLFVVCYVKFSMVDPPKAYNNGLLTYPAPLLFESEADQLWQNDGKGHFTNVTTSAGLDKEPQKGLALAIGDIDRDGDQDVFVANDTTPNNLWLNDGKGNFKDVAQLSGAAYSAVGREQANMGADFSDLDGNGLLDIADTTFQTEALAIYMQREPMLFEDIPDQLGVGFASRERLKFGIDTFDADNDGDEDILVSNGHIQDNIERNSETVTFAQQNLLFENLGGKFTGISSSAGKALADKQVSRGLATGDLNGDGLIDFVVNNNGGTAQIAFNSTPEKGNFVVFWLDGEKSNRNAIGARVVAKIGDKTYERQVMGSQSYLSVSDFRLHFGLGTADKIDELTIYWPDGSEKKISDLAGGKFYYLRQNGTPVPFIPGEKQIL
ncbi:MAG: CRTAC1 family protein [Pyrinomonadaceae bacterium]